MAKLTLSGGQQAQLVYLSTLPPKFERIHRLVEEIANMQGGETRQKPSAGFSTSSGTRLRRSRSMPWGMCSG